MTDEQMIELIARAISVPEHHTTWDILTDREKDLYLMQARAAHGVIAGKVAELTWQPIETAPKDGAAFLVTGVGYDFPEIIRWERYGEREAAEIGEEGYWTFAEQSLADLAHPEFADYSHWMPLPPSPALAPYPERRSEQP